MAPPTKPEEMIGQPIPGVTLTAHDGRPFPLRGRIGTGPQVLFFYIRNGTPG